MSKKKEKSLYGHAVLTDSCVAYVYLELCYISWPLFRVGGRSENWKGEGGKYVVMYCGHNLPPSWNRDN